MKDPDVATVVGRLYDNNHVLLASCFPVSNKVVVTCYHCLGNQVDGKKKYIIEWPKESIIRIATVDTDMVSIEEDIAFLKLQEDISDKLLVFKLSFRTRDDCEFKSFGFRKADHYNGLYSSGKVLGLTTNRNGNHLIQLESKNIDNGMSGAPVIDITYRQIIGMISEYWSTTRAPDSELAFAVPVSSMIAINPQLAGYIPELNATPKGLDSDASIAEKTKTYHGKKASITREDYVKACTRLSVLVAADQFSDGSWGRSLWKETSVKYTTDVADKEYVRKTHTKKALSATSWAAQALSKAIGNNNMLYLDKAVEFASAHRDTTTGAFGNIYSLKSGVPLISNSIRINSPRHTASGVKLLEIYQGISDEVIRGVEFILSNQCRDGGWGEAIGSEPNTLSTAYVLDALVKMNQIPGFKNMLPHHNKLNLVTAINKGIIWLISNRDRDCFWAYSNSYDFKPLYTAHVLAFIPQMVTVFPEDTISSMDSLVKLDKGGGIPASFNGEPDYTTTALCVYAMLRINPKHYKELINKYIAYLVNTALTDEWVQNYSSLEGIMGLVALSQFPNRPKVGIHTSLHAIFLEDLKDVYVSSNNPELWLNIDNKYGLGISPAIMEMYK